MGRTADDRLTRQTTAAHLGGSFRFASADTDKALSRIENAAEDLALTDGMPYKEALAIVSGQGRKPYGAYRR
jgi:hypothetical protein